MKTKTLVIDEARWGYGQGEGSLLGEDGKMCCLGFAAEQCRVKKASRLNAGMPNDLEGEDVEKFAKAYQWLFDEFGCASVPSSMLAIINDAVGTKLQTRRNKISKIFAANGVKVIFKK